jgi:hypothetical protein
MEHQAVSRESLLRSLDSLEQICVKRMKNEKLIDDKALPSFILSIQKALYEYSGEHSIPELASIASRLPRNVVLLQIPLAVDIIYYAVISFYLIGCFAGALLFLMNFFPLIVLIVIARIVLTMVFSYNRKEKLMYISDIVDEAQDALDNES